MNTARILSLDLDWFNFVESLDLRKFVNNFFSQLRTSCVLPKSVLYADEHHYLYPWCKEIMEFKKSKEVEIVNIDEHHDFYFADDIIDFEQEEINCANFFAFMANKGFIKKYTWICDAGSVGGVLRQRHNAIKCMSKSKSLGVRNLCKNFKVHSRYNAFSVLYGLSFDGFIIVKSPEYTVNSSYVYKVIGDVLRDMNRNFGTSTRRCTCVSSFMANQIPSLALTQAG